MSYDYWGYVCVENEGERDGITKGSRFHGQKLSQGAAKASRQAPREESAGLVGSLQWEQSKLDVIAFQSGRAVGRAACWCSCKPATHTQTLGTEAPRLCLRLPRDGCVLRMYYVGRTYRIRVVRLEDGLAPPPSTQGSLSWPDRFL